MNKPNPNTPDSLIDKSLQKYLLKAKKYLHWWVNHGYHLTKDRKGIEAADAESEKLRKIMERKNNEWWN